MTWRERTGSRLAAFAVAVLAAFGGGALLGAAIGPDPGDDPAERPGAEHQQEGTHG